MRDHEIRESDIIDLGDVSVETKGEAIVDNDPGAGQLVFGMGIVAD